MQEAEYRALAETVDRYIETRFRAAFTSHEREEICQDAFAGVAVERAKGSEIHNTEALLITCARNAANSRLRSADRRRRYAFDPQDSPEARTPDLSASPDVAVIDADENRRVSMLMGQLDERSRYALRLRLEFEFEAPEIASYLGISTSQVYRVLKQAARALSESIAASDAGAHSRQQRALLVACEMGLASAEERREAEQLLEDPHARALLAELRGLGRQAAALIPLPPAVAGEHEAGSVGEIVVAVKQQLVDATHAVKQHAASLVGRTPGQDTVGQIAATGGVRGSGAAVAAVAVCLGVGGVVVNECVQHGVPTKLIDVIPGVGRDDEHDAQPIAKEPAPTNIDPMAVVPAEPPPANPPASTESEREPAAPSEPAPVPPSASDSLSGLSGSPTPSPAPAPPPASPAPGASGGGSSGSEFGGL